jgi:hypothetical protein
MIGQCLSNKNESATVYFPPKKFGTKQGFIIERISTGEIVLV